MEIATLNTLFNWVGIVAAILVVVSTVGTFWTGKIIASQSESEISNLKTQVETLGPRMVSSEQVDLLVSKLSIKKGSRIGFVAKLLDTESKGYATQLSKIFNDAGWNVIESINQTLLDDFNGSINILIASKELATEADFVCATLNDVGISCIPQPFRDGTVSGTFDPNTIYLAIGSKVIRE